MDPYIIIGLLSLAMIFLAVITGIPIGVALALVSIGALSLMRWDLSMPVQMLGSAAFHGVMDYLFSVLPMFLLMGFLASFAGTAEDAYDIAVKMAGRIRGSLAIATVVANAIFAAITGVSIASAALFSKISLPQMLRYGYDKNLSLGTVAGSSVLGMLIPPSVLFILYGIIANESIGALYMAGILPGIILATVYCLGIRWMLWVRPQLVRREPRNIEILNSFKMPISIMMKKATPIAILVVLVLGGIYIGFFTPTEAGAAGAFIALLIGGINRRLTLKSFWNSLTDTAYISSSVLFILVAAQIYSRMLTISRVPNFICEFGLSLSLPPVVIIIFFLVVMIIMGCFLDSASIMLITMPIMVPVAKNLGFDPIWFGVLTVVAVETGLITPPFGMVVFTMKAALGEEASIEQIFRASFPFLIMILIVLSLLIAFPALSTWLPSRMGMHR